MIELLKRFFMWILEWVSDSGKKILDSMLEGVELLGLDADSVAAVSEWLSKVDLLFPLTEMIAYASSLFALWGVIFLYRVVKSWIPTVAS